jgi:hypothetical protein
MPPPAASVRNLRSAWSTDGLTTVLVVLVVVPVTGLVDFLVVVFAVASAPKELRYQHRRIKTTNSCPNCAELRDTHPAPGYRSLAS